MRRVLDVLFGAVIFVLRSVTVGIVDNFRWWSLGLMAFCLLSAAFFFFVPGSGVGRQAEIDVGLKALMCAVFFGATARFMWLPRGPLFPLRRKSKNES